jgi:HAD superfamily hydrolase (TIGR01490 family)
LKLALFDLDHTLLQGDSDTLWCDFLIEQGVLERESFSRRNADMETRYKAGTVGAQEFADFYVGTLAGRSLSEWEPYRQEFLATCIVPRITPAAVARVDAHLDAGDLVVMTTATNRFITELTSLYFDIEHLIATEAELQERRFTGRTRGVLNMREGKVARLHDWLRGRSLTLIDFRTTAYSDSINDLPLLEAVHHPVVVDGDPGLCGVAAERGWPTMSLR